VAIWVGFLALFGIASDNGVVVATYLDQSFKANKPETVKSIRQATIEAAMRRVRPSLMTTATTFLALIPVLTSTGRGSDYPVIANRNTLGVHDLIRLIWNGNYRMSPKPKKLSNVLISI
jgi:hypothetical protein